MAPYCEDAPDYVNVFLHCERCDLHAMLTTVGFAGLLTFGVFVSRYLRYRAWWWGLHLLAQAVGLAFVLSGTVVAIRFMGGVLPESKGGPGNTWVLVHRYVGYVTVGFLVVQTIFGLCTYFKRKVEGQRIPAFPDRIHWALNWLTLILAYTTIFTGLWVMVLPWYYKVIFGAYTACVVLFSLFLDIATYTDLRVVREELIMEPEVESQVWGDRGRIIKQDHVVQRDARVETQESQPLLS